MKRELKKLSGFISGIFFTVGVMGFSLGFALFVTSLIKIIEFRDPKITLLISLFMMLIPVILGIWEFKHFKKKIIHNLRRLKVD